MAPPEEIFADLLVRYPRLSPCGEDIKATFEGICRCYETGKKLLLCGNGGSASDAGHIAAELLKGFRSRRQLNSSWQSKLPEDLRNNLQGALPAIPLADLTAIHSAFINDCQPQFAFAQLVLGLGQEGDALIAISTSGNAANVIQASRLAREMDMKVFGLSGCDGGKLADLCDRCIRVPEKETYRIQELHLPVYHCLCAMVESHFFDSL